MNIRNIVITKNNLDTIKSNEKSNFNIKRLLNNKYLTQSQCIRCGCLIEKTIKEIIRQSEVSLLEDNLYEIYNNSKSKKQCDIAFIHKGTFYYFELKTNINLDTEKIKATDDKVDSFVSFFKNRYHNTVKEFKYGVLTCWYEYEEGLKTNLKTPIWYMKDIFEILDINMNKNEYYKIWSDFGKMVS